MAKPTPAVYSGQDTNGRGRFWPIAVFLAALFLLKIAIVFQLKDHPLLHPDAGLDTTAYAQLSDRVLAGNWALRPGLYYVSPLYIYVLAVIRGVFGSFTAVRIVQVALGTCAVGGIFVMARAWFGARAAWIAAAVAAATGLFTFYETLILQSAIDTFLTSAALTTLTVGLRAPAGSRASVAGLVAAGLAFGVGTLNRPNLLIAAAGVVLTCALLRRLRPALLLTAGLAMGLATVAIRNVAVAGQLSLVSSHGGLNLFIGNNADATGFYRAVPGIRPLIEGQAEDVRTVAGAALGRTVTDGEASDYFRDRALAWMRAHPVDAAALLGKKLYFTFHAQHVALPHSYPFLAHETGSILQYLVVGPWLLVPLGLAGLVLVRRFDAGYAIWLSFVPGYAAAVALFFVAERYRLPLLVPLSVGAGGLIDAAWRSLAAGRARALAVPLGVAAALAVAVNRPFDLNDGRWDDGLRTAQRLVITGDYAEADRWVARLERAAPRPGRAHHGVGMQLVLEDQPARALPHLRRSLELGYTQADDPNVWLRLGRLSARADGPARAEAFFQRGVALAPGDAAARQQHGLNLLLMGDFRAAADELTEAARLNPADVDALAHLAYCEIQLERLDAARAHVREALRIDADHTLSRQLAAAIGAARAGSALPPARRTR